MVIDALDECEKYQEFIAMIRDERPNFPLRIFITSRVVHDMQRLQRSLSTSAMITCIEIPVQDTINDIQRYIGSRIDDLLAYQAVDRDELSRNVLNKSNACFLWVRLVLDELENVYSTDSIMDILEQIPEGMVPYYGRIIKEMARNTREKHIAKALLVWTVACARKLTIQELSQALELDANIVIPSARSAVKGLCGQFLTLDDNSDIVDLVHPTAREFLLSEAAGEFRVTEFSSHERMALACLKLLSSNDLRAPRNPRFLTHARPPASPFLKYAMTQFSEHISLAPLKNDKLLKETEQFLNTYSLGWVERLALMGDLQALLRASKNLKAYSEKAANHGPHPSSQVWDIANWSVDLSRLATRFGYAILHDPSSIYFLIPPLCPSGSAVYQHFGKRQDVLSVVGYKDSVWDDCAAYVGFGEDSAEGISCSESLIGLEMGTAVHLYNPRSWQKEGVVHFDESISGIHLADDFIVCCTVNNIVLKELNGMSVWEHRVRWESLLITSADDRVLVVTNTGQLLEWDRVTGECVKNQKLEFRNYQTGELPLHNRLSNRVPQRAAISPDKETIALSYRGGTVTLWDVHGTEAEFIGWAIDEIGRPGEQLLFNPNPNNKLLLVMYTTHELSLYETWSGALVRSRSESRCAGILSAACSPNGRTLAVVDTTGVLYIRDFQSLGLRYRVRSPYPCFRALGFTPRWSKCD